VKKKKLEGRLHDFEILSGPSLRGGISLKKKKWRKRGGPKSPSKGKLEKNHIRVFVATVPEGGLNRGLRNREKREWCRGGGEFL